MNVSKLSLLPHFEGNSQKWIIDNSAAEIHEFTSSAKIQWIISSSGEGWVRVRRCLDILLLLCLWSRGKLNQSPSPPESGHMATLWAQPSVTRATLLALQSDPNNRWPPANEWQPSYKKVNFPTISSPKLLTLVILHISVRGCFHII